MKTSAKTKDEMVKYIPLEDLLPNPYQPATRREVDSETAKKFALSIQEHGLIQTPVVRQTGENGKYEIGDGWLRRAGFLCNRQEFGLQEYAKMPCVVRDLTDQQMADMVLEANTIRKDLNPIELAKLYKQYLDDFGIPQVELARRHNCSQGEIANTIRLLDLPADIQEKIISQEISETHGRQLLRLNYNPELQQKELDKAIRNGSSVNELSNSIASAIYFSSENIDRDDYPKPPFDLKECEACPNRQKIGFPSSSEKKKWRCLDKACYQKKAEKAEEDRVAKLTAEIEAARESAAQQEPPTKGKKRKKEEPAVVDTAKLTWRDYQALEGHDHIDNPEECNACPHRAIGRFFNDRTGPICINVKCFKAKEKTYQMKEAAKTRQAEHELTETVKAICDNPLGEGIMVKIIATHLVTNSRKETRDKFSKMYGISDPPAYFASSQDEDILHKLLAFVLQKERYEGCKGMFRKMLAELDGSGDQIDKQIADFREKFCKTCRYDKGGCRTLMHVFLDGKCNQYWKKKEGDEDEEHETPEELGEQNGHENEEIEASLPCAHCANAPTCDRTFFYAKEEGGYACDKVAETA